MFFVYRVRDRVQVHGLIRQSLLPSEALVIHGKFSFTNDGLIGKRGVGGPLFFLSLYIYVLDCAIFISWVLGCGLLSLVTESGYTHNSKLRRVLNGDGMIGGVLVHRVVPRSNRSGRQNSWENWRI